MPRVSQEYRDARRDEIADAALRCFAERGVQRTSMADIIAESGLSAGAIYGHFESKQQLIVEVARRVLGNRVSELGAMKSADEMPSPGQAVGFLVKSVADEFIDARLIVQFWGEAVTDDEIRGIVLNEVFVLLKTGFTDYLSSWAKRYRGLDDAEAAEFTEKYLPVLLGLGQGYIMQRAMLPSFNGEAYLATVREILPS
jgi:AcrR family transcriptional regulator